MTPEQALDQIGAKFAPQKKVEPQFFKALGSKKESEKPAADLAHELQQLQPHFTSMKDLQQDTDLAYLSNWGDIQVDMLPDNSPY